jgi:hypothetical protein
VGFVDTIQTNLGAIVLFFKIEYLPSRCVGTAERHGYGDPLLTNHSQLQHTPKSYRTSAEATGNGRPSASVRPVLASYYSINSWKKSKG